MKVLFEHGHRVAKITEQVSDLLLMAQHNGPIACNEVMVENGRSEDEFKYVQRLWKDKRWVCEYRWVYVLVTILIWSPTLNEIVPITVMELSPQETNKQLKKGLI